MGIYDVKTAHSLGTAFKVATKKSEKLAAKDIIDIFLFDLVSPWALVAEINSTHPLTGKRIKVLSDYAKQTGKVSEFDFEIINQEAQRVDKSRLYRVFGVGIVIYLLPLLAILVGCGIVILQPMAFPVAIIIVGLSFLIQGMYKFRRKRTGPEKTTILELMKDPYSNPLRGRYVALEGLIIGKADAGSYLGEDVKMQDKSDCLIYLNYESVIPLFGDLYFGLTKAIKMIGQHALATGWFRRSSYQVVDLDSIVVNEEKIKSYTRFWAMILGIIIIIIGFSFVWLFIPLLGVACQYFCPKIVT
jgi:small-conductance mechanosensitive channel